MKTRLLETDTDTDTDVDHLFHTTLISVQDMNLTNAARSMFRYLLLDEKNKILYAKVPKVGAKYFFYKILRVHREIL